jgi:hypothetical protein
MAKQRRQRYVSRTRTRPDWQHFVPHEVPWMHKSGKYTPRRRGRPHGGRKRTTKYGRQMVAHRTRRGNIVTRFVNKLTQWWR